MVVRYLRSHRTRAAGWASSPCRPRPAFRAGVRRRPRFAGALPLWIGRRQLRSVCRASDTSPPRGPVRVNPVRRSSPDHGKVSISRRSSCCRQASRRRRRGDDDMRRRLPPRGPRSPEVRAQHVAGDDRVLQVAEVILQRLAVLMSALPVGPGPPRRTRACTARTYRRCRRWAHRGGRVPTVPGVRPDRSHPSVEDRRQHRRRGTTEPSAVRGSGSAVSACQELLEALHETPILASVQVREHPRTSRVAFFAPDSQQRPVILLIRQAVAVSPSSRRTRPGHARRRASVRCVAGLSSAAPPPLRRGVLRTP